MSRHFLTNINLNKNELQNAAIQALSQDPLNPTQGQIYFSTVTNSLRQWTGSDWIDYLNSADGSNYIESVDANFTVDTQQLHLADDVHIDSSLTIGGTPITGPTGTNGNFTIDRSDNTTIFEVDANNNATYFYRTDGSLGATVSHSGTGSFRVVAEDDLSLRAVNDIILYPGNDDGGTGKAYVHWGNDATGAFPQNEITTAGNTQNLTNKTVTDELNFGSVPATSSYITQSGMDDASLLVIGNQDLVLEATNGNIILAASGASYIGSVNAENEVATKHYVDTVAQGLQIVAAVVAGSTASVDLSGTVTTVGGVTLANGNRVLIKNQVDATENGIYIYNSGTSMLEASTALDDTNLTEGHYVLVTQGTLAATGWIVSQYSAGATTWTQFSAANEYHAGTNIDITDNTISIDGIIAVTNGGTGADNAAGARANLGATTKYAENNESLTPITGQVTWVVTHNLDTTDVIVQVKDISSATLVEVDVEITNSNSVTVSWVASTIVNADSYRVVVIG